MSVVRANSNHYIVSTVARHYNPRFVFILPHVSLRFIFERGLYCREVSIYMNLFSSKVATKIKYTYSLINMRQLQILFSKPKLDMRLFVDLAEFTCFYQFLHELLIKLFCFDLQNNLMSSSCKNW